MNEVLKAIRTRRSVRRYTDAPVSREQIETILEAGRFAPSGKNTQPWRFVVVESETKRSELATLFPQQGLVAATPITLAVLLDREAGYDELKDVQGIGAAIENILLAVHALGLGACWMGKARDKEIERFLGAREGEELMALISIGYPAEVSTPTPRRPLADLTRFI
jgi:nitroreductase